MAYLALDIVWVLKLIQVLIISGVKFLFAPLISMGFGFGFMQTFVITATGGILGIMFFFFLSKWVMKQFYRYCPEVMTYFTGKAKEEFSINCGRPSRPRKVFTWRNKTIVRVRGRYGFAGIIILTPVLLSIPIGSFLASKYYSKRRNVLLFMSISAVVWAFFISSIFFLLHSPIR